MPYFLSGAFLILWSCINVLVDIQEYGWAEGNYFWFCNLALFGMGVGLLLRSRGVLTGFLSIASFTQTFWLIDNFYRQTTGSSLLGLTDFMYRPGYPISKFILSHYHYFTLLIGGYALCLLPKEKNRTLILSAIFNPLIFLISYFAFDPEKNVNCIHRSCLPSLIPGEGPGYAISFWASVLCVHLLIAYLMNRFFLNIEITPQGEKKIRYVFSTGLILAAGLSVHDTTYRLALPKFTCHDQKIGDIETGCKNTIPLSNDEFFVTYFVKNKSLQDQVCEILFNVNGKKFQVQDPTTLAMGGMMVQSYPLPSPEKDLSVSIVPDCKPFPERTIASTPE